MTAIDLHVFADASIPSHCTAVYAVVDQPSITNKGLLVSKSRISEKYVTTQGPELVSTHIGSNLVSNVFPALKTEKIRSLIGWIDSTVVLWCLNQSESYKPFVVNRMSKIK